MNSKKEYLYKFVSTNEFTYKNLILSQLHFNQPDLMNDQLEGIVKIKNIDFKPSTKAIEKFIINKKLDQYFWNLDPRKLKSNFFKFYMRYWYENELTKYRITCFSKTATESLMWAHYANKHTGLCLVYDKHILMESLADVHSGFRLNEIRYGIKPELTLWEKNGEIGYDSNIPILSAKDLNWKYEREVRIYLDFNGKEEYRPHDSTYFIPCSALKGIIYGYNISLADRDAIGMILRNEPLYNVFEVDVEIDLETGKILC